MKIALTPIALAISALMLVACGQDKGKTPEPATEAAETVTNDEPTLLPGQFYSSDKGFFERRKSPTNEYPTNIDFTSTYYHFDDSHRAFADLYVGLAKDTPDEVIVELLDPDFRKVTDAFARKDRVAEMQPKIAEYRAKVAGVNPNITIVSDSQVNVSPYNMETQSFTIDARIKGIGSSVEWSTAYYDMGALKFGVSLLSGWMNVQSPANTYSIKVDEATARKVEAYLSSKRGSPTSAASVHYRAQGYVLDTFASGNNRSFSVVVMPERYELFNKETGEVLLTIEHKDLAPKFRLTTSDVSSDLYSEIADRYGLETGAY